MASYSFHGRKRVWKPRDEQENRAIFSACKQETGIKMPQEFKPVYLANKEFEVEKWSVHQLMRLLRFYGAHRCLWDVNDSDNHNRKMRRAAFIDIATALGEGVTRTQVVQKINVLRSTYRYEKRRIMERMRKGVGARTKLKWFPLADAFLRHIPALPEFRRNKEDDSDLEDNIVFSIDPESLIPLEDEELEYKIDGQCDYWEDHVKEEPSTVFSVNNSPNSPAYESNASVYNASIPIGGFDLPIKEELHDLQVQSQFLEVKGKSPCQPMKHKWTSSESLKFVQLLKKQPLLWDTKLEPTKSQQTQAVQQIVQAMDLPKERIEKRLRIFKQTCKDELMKVVQDQNYKPGFVWWPLAASFMLPDSSKWEPAAFVDANDLPPATPTNSSDFKEDNINDEDVSSPINPIPSVAPASLLSEETFEMLFQKSSGKEGADILNPPSVSHAYNFAADSIAIDDTTRSTKLIWNGLEDDLLEGKWSLKHSVKFLRLYGAHRCLWDLQDPDYRSRELRNSAIRDIAAAMGYGLDADYVAKKIKIFRITYMQHRKRMLEAIKQGKEPEIQLRWFPLADSFLRPHIGLRSIKEQALEVPQFDFQYVYANLNLIDPALLTDFCGKGTQNTIEIGDDDVQEYVAQDEDGKRNKTEPTNECRQ